MENITPSNSNELDDRKAVEKDLENYLRLECPYYLGSEFSSMSFSGDVRIPLFEGEEPSRVLIYDVKLANSSEAFATIGGIAYSHDVSYSNVFPRDEKIKDADIAARMHLYHEAAQRYGHTSLFNTEKKLRRFADMLGLPEGLRG
jgi:hypothetical protein